MEHILMKILGEENIEVHMERLTIQALELVRCSF